MSPKRQNVRLLILTISFLLFPVIIFYFSPYPIVLGAFQGILAAAGIMFALQLRPRAVVSLTWNVSNALPVATRVPKMF